jgi:hypothetical protein
MLNLNVDNNELLEGVGSSRAGDLELDVGDGEPLEGHDLAVNTRGGAINKDRDGIDNIEDDDILVGVDAIVANGNTADLNKVVTLDHLKLNRVKGINASI